MQEAMINCIVRKTEGSTAIRIDESNQMLRKKTTDQTISHPSHYRMPRQLMISPSIPQKNHPPPARAFHRVTEEGVHLRRKSLEITNMSHKQQQEAKDRARIEQREEQTKTIQ
ncbi:hypothetical protein MKX03_020130, partial [Papaver bracteatum]